MPEAIPDPISGPRRHPRMGITSPSPLREHSRSLSFKATQSPPASAIRRDPRRSRARARYTRSGRADALPLRSSRRTPRSARTTQQGPLAAHANLIDKAISTAERAATLAGRLLLYARRDDTSPEPVFVGRLLEDMRALLEFSLGTGINLVINAPAQAPPIFVERHRLELALMNLATNARDAMPNGGTFSISVSEETIAPDQDAPALKAGDYVRISVSDSGCGMNEATLARAVEPLFTTKKATRGTGLGLSMVKEFLEQSGGAWRLTSVEGLGTTVDIWLPQMAAT
jgi:signal transduction histidine kinase